MDRKPSANATAGSAYLGRSRSVSRTNCSARACSAGVTRGVPLRSIGFDGSYGFGPATVVGVGDVGLVVPPTTTSTWLKDDPGLVPVAGPICNRKEVPVAPV